MGLADRTAQQEVADRIQNLYQLNEQMKLNEFNTPEFRQKNDPVMKVHVERIHKLVYGKEMREEDNITQYMNIFISVHKKYFPNNRKLVSELMPMYKIADLIVRIQSEGGSTRTGKGKPC